MFIFLKRVLHVSPLLGLVALPIQASAQTYSPSNTPSVGCASTAIGSANFALPGTSATGLASFTTPASNRANGTFAVGDSIAVNGVVTILRYSRQPFNPPVPAGSVTVFVENEAGTHIYQQFPVAYPGLTYLTPQALQFSTLITMNANDVAAQGGGGLRLRYTQTVNPEPLIQDVQHTVSCASLPTRPMQTRDQMAAVSARVMEAHGTTLSGGVSRAVKASLVGSAESGLSSSGFFLSFRGGSPIRQKAREAAHILGIAPITDSYDSGADEKLNIWLTGRLTGHDGAGFSGHSINAAAGVDYKFKDNVTAGVLVGTEIDNIGDMGVSNGTVEGRGITFGLYGGTSIAEKLLVDGMLSYSLLSYDVDDQTNTAEVDADRITFALNVSGSYTFGNGIVLVPKLAGLYSVENQDAYIDSGDNTIAAQTVTYGRVTAGGRISKSFEMDSGLVMAPFLGLDADYEFIDANGVAVTSGLTATDGGVSARVSAGFDAQLNQALSLAVEGDVGGLGDSDYTSYSARANVDWNF